MRLPRDRHEDGLVQGEVEPGGVGGVRALAQYRPQGQVVPAWGRDRHMVGDDVHHDAHSMSPGLGGQGLQLVASAHDGGDPAVVDDVVAVCRARRGRQHRGEVEVGDPEIGQVWNQGLGVGEGEACSQLEGGRWSLACGARAPARARPGAYAGISAESAEPALSTAASTASVM